MLREILERDLCGNARVQGERLRAGFERLAQKHGVIGDIRGKGLFQGIEFVREPGDEGALPGGDGVRRARRPAGAGRMACCAASTRTGSPSGRRWSSTAEQIDEMVELLDRSMGEVLTEMRGDFDGRIE